MLNRFTVHYSLLIIVSIVYDSQTLSHTKGHAYLGKVMLHQQNLFARNVSNPRNYTIAYQHFDSGVSGIIDYVQLDVNGAQESNATIVFSVENDIEKKRFVKATAQVRNASNFTSNIMIMGIPGIKIDVYQLEQLLNIKRFQARSYGLICTENYAKHSKRKTVIYEFGNRIAGDFLIYFQNEFVEAGTSTPKFTFDFNDFRTKISYLALTVDSPWAIIFRNKIHITDHQFRATVFGLDRVTFFSKLIIFGTHN